MLLIGPSPALTADVDGEVLNAAAAAGETDAAPVDWFTALLP